MQYYFVINTAIEKQGLNVWRSWNAEKCGGPNEGNIYGETSRISDFRNVATLQKERRWKEEMYVNLCS